MSSIRGAYFRKLLAVVGARFCAFGNELSTKLVNETNSERRFKRARWRGCAQRSWIKVHKTIYKKTLKMRSGRGCKNHYFQPSPKTSPNVFGNVFEIVQKSIKCRSGCIVEKTTNKVQKTTSPKGEPRTSFSHPKVHLGGPLGPLGSKTLPTQPQDPPKPRFLLICVPSGVICHRFVVHISENCSPLLVLVSVLSGMNFQRNL